MPPLATISMPPLNHTRTPQVVSSRSRALRRKHPSNEYPGVALFASKPLSSAPKHFTCDLEAVASNDPFAASSDPLRDPAECHETMPDLEPEPDPELESSAPVPSLEFPLCLILSISSPLLSPLLVSTPFYCSSLLSHFLFVSTHFSPLSAILDIHSINLPSQVPIPERFSHPVSYFYHSQVPTILVSPHISDSLSPSHFSSSFPPPCDLRSTHASLPQAVATFQDTSLCAPVRLRNALTLGTRTQIPTRHMLDTLGVQTTSDSNVPSGYRLGTF